MVDDKKKDYDLGNAILGKKYFRAWQYTTHTNHHWEMFFSLSQIWLRYGIEINRQINFGQIKVVNIKLSVKI